MPPSILTPAEIAHLQVVTMRRNVDDIDVQIQALLLKRKEYTDMIQIHKKASGIAIDDPDREADILRRLYMPWMQSIYKAIFQAAKQGYTGI